MTEPSEVPDHELTREEQAFAIKTWRYLRLALVALVVGLVVSVTYERTKVDCWQTSLSAYYYTPVHAYFVSALVAMGVCMFCLAGTTPAEDILLNIGGIFAVIVGLVPTPHPGHCASVLGSTIDRNVNVNNNVIALIALGAISLGAIAVLWWKKHELGSLVGYCVTAAIWLAATLVFFADENLFREGAHGTAAVLLFACVTAVVFVNARDRRETGRSESLRNRYGVIGWVMVASAIASLASRFAGFEHYTLVAETALIGLFAVFWLTQTIELWGEGLR